MWCCVYWTAHQGTSIDQSIRSKGRSHLGLVQTEYERQALVVIRIPAIACEAEWTQQLHLQRLRYIIPMLQYLYNFQPNEWIWMSRINRPPRCCDLCRHQWANDLNYRVPVRGPPVPPAQGWDPPRGFPTHLSHSHHRIRNLGGCLKIKESTVRLISSIV